MNRYHGDAAYDHREVPAVGVLLTNVGTPEAPTTPALRRYLAQFLSDPRVIENQGLLWKLILHGIILRTRPRRSAAAYRAVWTESGSPLLVIMRHLAAGVEARLRERVGSPLHVEVGMGYGAPAIPDALERLQVRGCRRILVFPLFPQYAAATVGSTFDAVTRALQKRRWVPELRFIHHYHDHAGYIRALAATVREAWSKGGEPDRLLLSFHGLPKNTLLLGDPYHCHCHKTARLLAAELHLPGDRWALAFQSRFGRDVWLRPYTDETLKTWGREGRKHVDVMCPGFSVDCLETIEEIGVENRGYFVGAGGGEFRYIPALNDRSDHVGALADLALTNLHGWVTHTEDWDQVEAAAAAEAAQRRADAARALGLNV